jgi:hypothetical protein
MHLSLQAANIKRHYFADTDIVYVLRSGFGRIIRHGNAESLNALYQDVPYAIQAYWNRRDARRIRPDNIR